MCCVNSHTCSWTTYPALGPVDSVLTGCPTGILSLIEKADTNADIKQESCRIPELGPTKDGAEKLGVGVPRTGDTESKI